MCTSCLTTLNNAAMSNEFRKSGIPSTSDGNPKRVRAIYNFKGDNNDELCFKKGDLIVVTQMPSGGWWEGTLDGNTGWFPCNYVEDCSAELADESEASGMDNSFINDDTSQQYRNMVYKELMDYESVYISELQETMQKYLLPLQRAKILPEKDINLVVECFKQLLDVHSKFISYLEELRNVGPKEQRVGGAFMSVAAQLKDAHLDYCSLHPKFVHFVEKKKDDICFLLNEANAASNVTVLLTTSLSYSFRHLDKYPATLQQLQRYTDEAHPDRGDLQRASFVYREIVNSCLLRRRQKEMELEVMLGNVRNWPEDDVPIENLGSAVNMGPVKVMITGDSGDATQKDRYLVLFPFHLLILSVSSEMTSFVFDRLLPLQDLTLPRLPDQQSTKETFEILVMQDDRTTGPNTYTFRCQRFEEVKNWIKLMNQCKNNNEFKNAHSSKESKAKQHLMTRNTISSSGSHSSVRTGTEHSKRSKYWSKRSLLPNPPMRCSRSSSLDSDLNDHKSLSPPVSPSSKQAEDVAILQVIEAYYLSGRLRKQANQDVFDSSQILLADEDKVMNEHRRTNRSETADEKTMTEMVYALQAEVKEMRAEMEYLADCLKTERKARRKLKSMVERLSLNSNR